MQLEHGFTVPVPVDTAWRVLLDVERIAPCMPGATLTGVDGSSFTGKVKVKVGPIGLTYGGSAAFVEVDEAAHRVVIDANGKETRGTGTAAAKVTATLREEDGRTHVAVVTDLTVTGKPAQFGRGVMADVGGKIIGMFAECLAGELADGSGATADAAPAAAAPGAAAPGAVGLGAAAPGAAGLGAAAPAAASPGLVDAGAAPTTSATDVGVDGRSADAPGGPPAEAGQVAAAAAAGLAAGTAAASTSTSGAESTGVGRAAPEGTWKAPAVGTRPKVEAIDLLDTAGAPVLKRLAPVAAVIAVLLLLLRRRRRP